MVAFFFYSFLSKGKLYAVGRYYDVQSIWTFNLKNHTFMGNLEKPPICNFQVDRQLSDKNYITPPSTFMCCTMYSLAILTSLQSEKSKKNHQIINGSSISFKKFIVTTVFFYRVSFFGIPEFLFYFLTEIYILCKY